MQDIIAVEKEIQEKLEAERKKAAEWVNQQKEEIEREFQNSLGNLQAATCNKQEGVKKAASEKSEEIINQAVRRTQNLEGLSEEILLPIVLHHIARINPRKAV